MTTPTKNPEKIALVTGGNKGIGLETIRQLARTGQFTVLLAARDLGKGQPAADALRQEGFPVQFLALNVNEPASIAAAVDEVTRRFGRLDVLVNNAGVFPDVGVPAAAGTSEAWRQTFDTNVFALVAVTQAFLPLLKNSAAGRIVNLTSILGSLALAADPKSPLAGTTGNGAAYGASKAAVNMYTVHLARDLERAGLAIKVNAGHPGWVKTDMGGAEAPMEIVDGAKTSVQLATLPADGPNGGYFHLGKPLPW